MLSTEFNIDIAKEVWEEERQAVLDAKDAEIAAKDEEIAAKDAEIAAKDAENKKLAALLEKLQSNQNGEDS